jgi:alpha-tubulin suppressor-like RCC1 family protein
LLLDSTVKCWGTNRDGQLGNGTTVDSKVPVAVVGLNGVRQLALGDDHSCALLGDGSVRCWGTNRRVLDRDPGTNSLTPVQVSGVVGVLALSARGQRTCALLEDRAVTCWGEGSAPTTVTGLAAAASSLGGDRCAVLSNRALQCWDNNYQAYEPSKTTGVEAVWDGSSSNCLVLSGGSVECWGIGTSGQLGNGAIDDYQDMPKTVADVTGVTDIALGNEHTCALTGDRVVCWGAGDRGQRGLDASSYTPLTPLEVPQLSGVTALAGGVYHTCALLNDGSARCWGSLNGSAAAGLDYGPSPTPPPSW